jgi:hypothetical protein
MAKAEMRSTTRRAVLAGIATAPALAAPAIALGAEPAEGDPIYAAIERHRAALAEFEAARSEEELNETGDAHVDALADLLETKPTTAAGCAAALRYVGDLVAYGPAGLSEETGLFANWAEVSESGRQFLGLIADALERLT